MALQICVFPSPSGPALFSRLVMCPSPGLSDFHSLQESFLTLFPSLLAYHIALHFWNIWSIKSRPLTYCSGAGTLIHSHKRSHCLHFYPRVMGGDFSHSHPITILMVYTNANLHTSGMVSLLLNFSF